MAVLTTNSPTQTGIHAIFAWPRGYARRIADWRAVRRTMSELSALTDRELADIGLTRSQIREVALSGRR